MNGSQDEIEHIFPFIFESTMTVGEKIKLLRKRERMTQARLAEFLNVTTRSVIYFERNQRNPSEDIL